MVCTVLLHLVRLSLRCKCTHLHQNLPLAKTFLCHTLCTGQIQVLFCIFQSRTMHTPLYHPFLLSLHCKCTHSYPNPRLQKISRLHKQCTWQTQEPACTCQKHIIHMFLPRQALMLLRCRRTHSNPTPALQKTCLLHTRCTLQTLRLSCRFQRHTNHIFLLHPIRSSPGCNCTHLKPSQTPQRTFLLRTRCMKPIQVLSCRCQNNTRNMFPRHRLQLIQRYKCRRFPPNLSQQKTSRWHKKYKQQNQTMFCKCRVHRMHTLPRLVQSIQRCTCKRSQQRLQTARTSSLDTLCKPDRQVHRNQACTCNRAWQHFLAETLNSPDTRCSLRTTR